MPAAPFRLFGFGPNGTPTALAELMADPSIYGRMNGTHFGRSIALADAELRGMPDAQLRGLARALGLVNKHGRATPGEEMKAAMGLPRKLEKVTAFVEAVGRDAVAIAVVLLGDEEFPDPTPELHRRIEARKMVFSVEAILEHVTDDDGREPTYNAVFPWRRTPEYRAMVRAAAERIIEVNPAGLNPLDAYQARATAVAVSRDDLLTFVGGGAVPELVLPG